MSWNIKTPGDYINGPLTVAGTATVTGALTVGTTLGVTGQSTLTGNVGVGVTPTAWGVGTKALQVGSTAYGSLFDFLTDFVAVTANLHWTGSNYGRMSASSKFATAYYQEINAGAHQWLSSTAAGTNAVAPTMVANMTLTAAGNLSLANGDLVVSNGKGIDFSATSRNGTSELLNDYEEGTWTPALSTDDVPFTSVSYVQQDGHYTKVGRLVTFCGTIYTSGVVKGAANGVVTITGLPFQQVAGLNSVLCYAAAFWASDSPVSGVVDNYRILLLKRPTTLGVATGTQTLTVAEVATGGTSNFLRFSGQYYV